MHIVDGCRMWLGGSASALVNKAGFRAQGFKGLRIWGLGLRLLGLWVWGFRV